MYSDYLKINKNFQTSINLSLDIQKSEKIDEYIPTSDICDVLKKYIATILGHDKNKATTLVGPYGKGKSFLLLVLSYLTSADAKDPSYKKLVKKISKIDQELASMIQEMNKKKIKLLTVVVDSNYNDLKQAFRLALNDALSRDGLDDIVPNTVFSVCLDLIGKWKANPDINETILKTCKKMNKIDLDELEQGLKHCSEESYKQFETLYNCVTTGLEFSPLVSDDISKLYADVNRKLTEHGYTGMFIVFDEFSKFLEGSDHTLAMQLNLIQSMAEYCNRTTKDEQMHICCVTHKAMQHYEKSKDDARKAAFKTVEGRFKEIRFNRSLDENYQLLSYAIQRKNKDSFIDVCIETYKDFYNEVFTLDVFKNAQSAKKEVIDSYPLNPLTAYALIQLSERIAQNERTLFTFLSDTDENSLNSFIHTNDTGMFNVDKIYDYFSDLLRASDDEQIKTLWYRTEGKLSVIEDPMKRKVMKTIAVISMVNEPTRFAAVPKNIALSLAADLNEVDATIEKLINEKYLRRNTINNQLIIGTANNKLIEDQVETIISTRVKNISSSNICDKINEDLFELPRKYNTLNRITRFFSVYYLTEKQFKNMKSFDELKNRRFCDGVIINLLRNQLSDEEIIEKMNAMNEVSGEKDVKDRAVVRYPSKPIREEFYDLLQEFAALRMLMKSKDNDETVSKEISLMSEEVKSDILTGMDVYFGDSAKLYSMKSNKKNLSDMLSDIMNQIFSEHLIFNNELINKNEPSSQYQKSANKVIDWLLSEVEIDFPYTETSAEGTIKNTIIDPIKDDDVKREVVEKLKEDIVSSEHNKISVSKLAEKYGNPPYGIRKGIMTMLIAYAINELSDSVILYFRTKEIELTARNLQKAVYSEDEYRMSFAKGSEAQLIYLNKLMALLNVPETYRTNRNAKLVCEGLRRFYMGLPLPLRLATTEYNVAGLSNALIEYKDLFMRFDINQYETLFIKSLEIFDTKDYDEVYNEINDFYLNWNQYLDQFKQKIVDEVKKIYGINQESSLKVGLNSYIDDVLNNSKAVLEGVSGDVYNVIINKLTYNDLEAINEIANITTETCIEDWSSNKTELLIENMMKFKDDLANAKQINSEESSMGELAEHFSETELGPMAVVMQNSIESVFEEFGDSVTNEEKAAILLSFIKNI